MGVTCPSCGTEYDAKAFSCPRCEALLGDSVFAESHDTSEVEEPTIVRRMLMPPDMFVEAPAPQKPVTSPSVFNEIPTAPTVVADYGVPANSRPRLAPNIDLRDLQLTVFEAYVVSRVDGTATVEELRTALELSLFEIQVVVDTLKTKGVIEIVLSAAASKRAPMTPEKPPIRPRPASPGAPAAQPAPATAAAKASRPPAKPSTAPAAKAEPATAVPATKKRSAMGVDDGMRRHLPWMRAVGLVRKNPLQEAIQLEQNGDLQGAIELLEEAIERSKEPAPLYNRLALVLIKERRDFDRAEELLERAEKLDPVNRTYQSNLQKVLILKTKHGSSTPDR